MVPHKVKYAHDVILTGIAKRNFILAFCKKDYTCPLTGIKFEEDDSLECSGYWDVEGGAYVQISDSREPERIGKDLVLKCDEWDIFVLVEFDNRENNESSNSASLVRNNEELI